MLRRCTCRPSRLRCRRAAEMGEAPPIHAAASPVLYRLTSVPSWGRAAGLRRPLFGDLRPTTRTLTARPALHIDGRPALRNNFYGLHPKQRAPRAAHQRGAKAKGSMGVRTCSLCYLFKHTWRQVK